jgi:DNA-binding transcriptional LysR family regulator
MDKLRAMRFFCRVVEAKSYAAAAQSLDVVPSALSKVIAALEADLGFRLLNRSTRSLSLSDEGANYFEHCRQILQDIEAAESQGRGGAAQARGTLRVGMHPALRFEMLTWMGRFLDAEPDVKVETVITNSPSAVVDEGLDLVLHIGRLSDSSLVAKPLGSTVPVVCASPDYLQAWGEPHHPSELARHRAVIYARRDEETNTRWAFTKGGETCEVEVPVRTISRDGIGLVDAALGGCGVARPLDIAARHWLGNGRLRPLLSDWTGEALAVTAVLPPHGRSAPAKVRRYLDHAAEALRAQG